jgi:hypothetical protein
VLKKEAFKVLKGICGNWMSNNLSVCNHIQLMA